MAYRRNLILKVPLKAGRLNPYHCRGQVVVIMLMIAMVIGVVIPMLVYMLQHEAKWTVKEIKSTRAFHLAEAGLDRGFYKLNETDVWEDAIAGTHIAGYYGDTEYSDLENGYYKIKIATSTEEDEVLITASGKDKETSECRTIQATYYRAPGITGALTAPGITAGGNFLVHWGSISSLGGISLTGSADECFPRKYARGQITCIGGAHEHNDAAAGPPISGPSTNSDGTVLDEELKEWHTQYDVPDIPEIDFDAYETDARNGYVWASSVTGGVYISTGNNIHGTLGKLDLTGGYDGGGSSGYYDGETANIFTTYYAEGDVTLKSCNLVGVIICKGNMYFETSNKGVNLSTTPHSTAWKEYMVQAPNRAASTANNPRPDTAAAGEYPGDTAYQTSNTAYAITNPAFQGFIYVHGNAECNGGGNIYGAVLINGSALGGSSYTIYYDKTAGRNVKTRSTVPPTRLEWKELPPQWDPLP